MKQSLMSGETQTLQQKITYDLGSIHIPVNLGDALRRARQAGQDCVLWADAVYINWKDLLEQTAQVPVMGRIFEQATRIFTWVGGIMVAIDVQLRNRYCFFSILFYVTIE
jgi:hypothetical protein